MICDTNFLSDLYDEQAAGSQGPTDAPSVHYGFRASGYYGYVLILSSFITGAVPPPPRSSIGVQPLAVLMQTSQILTGRLVLAWATSRPWI